MIVANKALKRHILRRKKNMNKKTLYNKISIWTTNSKSLILNRYLGGIYKMNYFSFIWSF